MLCSAVKNLTRKSGENRSIKELNSFLLRKVHAERLPKCSFTIFEAICMMCLVLCSNSPPLLRTRRRYRAGRTRTSTQNQDEMMQLLDAIKHAVHHSGQLGPKYVQLLQKLNKTQKHRLLNCCTAISSIMHSIIYVIEVYPQFKSGGSFLHVTYGVKTLLG
eukprot:TRINITY_DN11285_c0_g1_i1.p1 TRINITY_DN11285_c0_g1~~TRINITY_DN11285_c0_g1_i1.p1  ORF type:complete len:161 (+),score=7.89 TRINITY_DN11285_c0_g1_i1:330-812(+)